MSGIKARAQRGALEDLTNGEGRRTPIEYVTAQPNGNSRIALDTNTQAVYYITQGANPEAGSNARTLNLTGHSARRGDLVRITSTANGILEYEIAIDSVTANTITFVGDLSADLAIADTVDILRPVTLRAASDGGLATGPVSFVRDGTTTDVTEDTVTPANNIPLPVKLTSVTGDINITANDLNVQLQHTGANPDSVQVGDGTEIMLINASGEAQVRDDDANTTLSAINAKLVDGTDIGDVTINNAGAGAAVNIQDGGNSITVDDGGLTLSVDATDLDIRDLSHTQDSIQLGDGVETVAVNASNELQVRDDDANTTLTALNGKFSSLGQKGSGASAPVVLASDQENILSAIQTAVEIIDNAISGTEMQVDIVSEGNVATEATLSAMSAKLPAALGQTTSANSLSIVPASDAAFEQAGDDVVAFTLMDFSSNNVSNGAYTQLIADIGATAGKKVTISTKTGEALYLATGAPASETNRMIIPAGGFAHTVDIALAANARLSLSKVTAGTVDVGDIIINVLG